MWLGSLTPILRMVRVTNSNSRCGGSLTLILSMVRVTNSNVMYGKDY